MSNIKPDRQPSIIVAYAGEPVSPEDIDDADLAYGVADQGYVLAMQDRERPVTHAPVPVGEAYARIIALGGANHRAAKVLLDHVKSQFIANCRGMAEMLQHAHRARYPTDDVLDAKTVLGMLVDMVRETTGETTDG